MTQYNTEFQGEKKLVLPPSSSNLQGSNTINAKSSVIIIGANGSGKTRLGTWIDLNSPQKNLVHRVAAQKSLVIPATSPTSSLEFAERDLLYGNHDVTANAEFKVGHKWQSKPNTIMQSDYGKLLTFLFTDEFDKSLQYRQQAKLTGQPGEPPETRLDIVKRIWEFVLPHRELVISGGQISAQPKDSKTPPYHASEMSDGERVIIYLIGQCLAAKAGGIVVIDEPELHIHRSLQGKLWDAIEAERPDCLFVYLTHDLDFAATRINATKIWLKSYQDEQWDWHLVPANEEIPERLFLEILGSRKSILFVEGDKDSLDYFFFSRLFKDFNVVPCGGSPAVIHSTVSFSHLKHLHNLECRGIVDRDFRSDEQVEHLKSMGVFCLNVSEIENIILTEDVLREVAVSLLKIDIDNIITQTKNLVFAHISKEQERLISSIVAARIEENFKQFNAKVVGETNLNQSLTTMVSKIDVSAIYLDTEKNIRAILTTKDYPAALRLYNNKGLISQVSGLFGFKPSGMLDFIKCLMSSKNNQKIINAMYRTLPELSGFSTIPQPQNKSANDYNINAPLTLPMAQLTGSRPRRATRE